MQIGGIGNEHNSGHHNVTNCLHEHSVGKKDSGAFRSGALDSITLSSQNVTPQQEGQLSLSAWLDKTLHSGKDLLQRIWGSDPTAVTSGTGGQSLESQVLAALADGGVDTGLGTDTNGQNSRSRARWPQCCRQDPSARACWSSYSTAHVCVPAPFFPVLWQKAFPIASLHA